MAGMEPGTVAVDMAARHMGLPLVAADMVQSVEVLLLPDPWAVVPLQPVEAAEVLPQPVRVPVQVLLPQVRVQVVLQLLHP